MRLTGERRRKGKRIYEKDRGQSERQETDREERETRTGKEKEEK